MAGVQLTNVRKQYGGFGAIHGVDIEVRDGEFVVLVGPSGCGKSTLLRMIAGLEDITGGTISIGGAVVNDLPPKDRDIAMVFQSYALYPHLSVAENLGFSLRLARVGRAEAETRVHEAARILGLEELLDRYPRHLSGGQRQRVAMGRALVRKPAVFLFDEPLSNLDAKLRVSMRSEIKALHQRLGTTIIYVTHDQVEAMTMADRIVVLRGGRVEQIGTPMELYEIPVNSFVATFIGSPSMNLIAGEVRGGAFVAGDAVLLPLGTAAASLEGRPVVLGVRPEHLKIEEGVMPGVIRTVEPTGAQTYVTMTVAGNEVVAMLSGNAALRSGESISIAPLPGSLHLFDADSGVRIATC